MTETILKPASANLREYCGWTGNTEDDIVTTGTIYHDTAGKPVMNFTATCKRMLRVNRQRGDFFYYENAPEQVKLLINGMNLDGLAELYKVTKDRRI